MADYLWLYEEEALILQEQLLAAHGGAPGLRDRGLLSSALARPQQHAAYAEKDDPVRPAALYTAGIVRNHPFVDGNKRLGFLLGVLFLETNGYRFTASQEEATQAVLLLAAGELDENAYYRFLADNSEVLAEAK